MTELATITMLDAADTEDLLAEKYVRSSLMAQLTAALRTVVGTNQSIYYAKPLTESQVNNLRTTAQRHGMKISVHKVRRHDTDGVLIQAFSLGPQENS